MHTAEEPVLRAYLLVEIPGQGKFAIYIRGGIQHGLWQIREPHPK